MKNLRPVFYIFVVSLTAYNLLIAMEDKELSLAKELTMRVVKAWEASLNNPKPININDTIRFWTSGFTYNTNSIFASSYRSEEEAVGAINMVKEKAEGLTGLTEWWVTPSTNPDNMCQILQEHGFALYRDLTVMVHKLDCGFDDDRENSEICVKRLTDPDEIEGWDALLAEAFGRTGSPHERYLEFLKSDLQAKHKEYYAGYYNEQLAGTGCLVIFDDYAYLYNGAVGSKFRQKGIAKKMAKFVLLRLKNLGLKYVFVITGTDSISKKMSENLGFKKLFDIKRLRMSF